MFGKSSNGFTSVESLQKQVSDSISLFTTVREKLVQSCEKLKQQIEMRDAEIEKLSAERTSLDQLNNHSLDMIGKIDQIIA